MRHLRQFNTWAAVVMVMGLTFGGRAFAMVHTWTGPSGGNWSSGANWTGGAPTSGEAGGTIVEFNAGSTSNDDLAGLVVDQIHFKGTGNTINGTTSLTITGANLVVNIQDDVGGNTLSASLPLVISGASVEASVTAGTLTMNGVISGSVGFIKTGFGTLAMILSNTNTYTGTTTVFRGVMQLNASVGTVIQSTLVIGNAGDPAGSATLMELNSSDIASTSAVQILSSGVLDVRGHSDVVGALSGTGSILLNATASLAVNSDNSTSTFDGTITGPAGAFTKQGTGSLTLTGANTFSGNINVNKGTLLLNSGAANTTIQGTLKVGVNAGPANSAIVRLLQSSQIADTSAVTVNSDGQFDLNNLSEQCGALTINSGNVVMGTGALTTGGLLTMAGGSVTAAAAGMLNLGADIAATSTATVKATISGPVALNATRTFTITAGPLQPELTISGIIRRGAAASGFTKTGAGTMLLQGSAANTYSGVTTVDKGVLQITDTVGVNIPGALVIGNSVDPANSAILLDMQSSDISTTTAVTINASGQFNLNSFTENVGSLSGGGTVKLVNGLLAFGLDNSSQTYAGTISGTGSVLKKGTGTQTFSAANTYTGVTGIQAGVLLINGSQPGSAVSVSGGGTLGGTGTVGAVNVVAAKLAPGTAQPGQLSTGNLTLDTNSTITLRLNDSTNGFDSLNVTGAVTLGNCAIQLVVSPGFTGSGALTLINNDGVDAISGVSQSFTEGQTVAANGVSSKFSYIGGSGNDAALTIPNIPPMLTSAAFATPSPAVVNQPVTLTASASDANNDTLTYTWTFGDGANGTGATVMHTYTALGVYNVNVSIDDGKGGVIQSMISLVVGSDIAPTLQINAAPAPAGVGQLITFTAPSGSTENSLTYAWTFGDGSTGSGATATHAYSAAGNYNVAVVISDGLGGSGMGMATVTVNAPLVGTGKDSDGDGFSDGFETAVGTNPNDPASTVTGEPAVAGAIQPLTVSKASIKLNFAKGGSDLIAFSGTLSVPAGFAAAGAPVNVDVSGVTRTFTLDSKGNAKSADGSVFALSIKSSKGSVAAQSAKYKVSLPKGTFAPALALAGLTGTADAKAKSVTVSITVVFNQSVLQKVQPLTYTAKKGKTGSAR